MNAIHLQGLGSTPAKPASDLIIGDVVIFNYGYRYEVMAIEPSGKVSIATKMKSFDSGKMFDRRFKLNTLVAIANG